MNLQTIIVVVLLLLATYYGLDAFFEMVGAIYAVLDQYLWAFFAGIIAFIFAMTLMLMIIKISMLIVMFCIVLLAGIFSIFE